GWRRWLRSASTAIMPAPVVQRLCLGGAVAALLLAVLAFHWRGHGQVTRSRLPAVAIRPQPGSIALAPRPTPQAPKHEAENRIANLRPVPPGTTERRQPGIVAAPTTGI